jgi:hypothetical protein
MHALVKNDQTGQSTEIIIDSIETTKTLPDSAFTPSALEH